MCILVLVYPDFMETQYKKNVQLDDHLKSVYVSSTDPEVCFICAQMRYRMDFAKFMSQ